MAGSSIFLMLTCAVMLIQGSPFQSVNSNINSNILHRRNYNSNANSNIMANSLKKRPRYNNDEVDDNLPRPLEKIREKLSAKGHELAAAAAIAAAQESLLVTKAFMDNMADSTAVAVATAVGNILTDPALIHPRPLLNRRNSNYNVNSNTNIMGYDMHPKPKDILEVENSLESLLGLIPRSYNDDTSDPSYVLSHETGASDFGSEFDGILRDNDESDEGEKVIFNDDDEVDKDVEHEEATVPPTDVGSRALNGTNRRDYNSVNNRLNAHRRNINNNSNMNVFRRNINSNTNINSYRRSGVNTNANSNQNRYGHRYYRN